MAVAVGQGDDDAAAGHGLGVDILENFSVVVVVGQQRFSVGRVVKFLALDRKSIHVGWIDAEERYRAKVVAVEHGDGFVSFEVLAQELGHLDEVPECDAQPLLA